MDEAVSLMTPDALNTRVPIPNMTSKKDGMNGLSAIGMPRSVSGVAARWLGSIPHAIKLLARCARSQLPILIQERA